MDEVEFKEALANWINGNRSELSKIELIAIAAYYDGLYHDLLRKTKR